MSVQPRIFVLAPVHNRCATTEAFIRRLLTQTYTDWHLLLIDDGSKDGTADMARSLVPAPSLTLLRGTGNWWWAGSLQQGFLWLKRHRVAPDGLVVTMNDDTEFDPDFLANAVKAIKPRSLLQAQCRTMAGELFEVGVHWDWRTLLCLGVVDITPVNCFATRGLFLHIRDFLELGGFYPVLLPHYLSDYEFTLRAHRKGFALISAPEVFLRFDDSPALTGIRSTEGQSALQKMRTELSIRSTANPVYWTSFVLLSCPLRYVPMNVFRVWSRYLGPVRNAVGRFLAPIGRIFAPLRHFLGRVKRKIQREWAAWTGATR